MCLEDRLPGRGVEQVRADQRHGRLAADGAELLQRERRLAVADVRRRVAELGEGFEDVAVLDLLIIGGALDGIADIHAERIGSGVFRKERGDAGQPAELSGEAPARDQPPAHVGGELDGEIFRWWCGRLSTRCENQQRDQRQSETPPACHPEQPTSRV